MPGRDAPWDIDVLYDYMKMRSATCSPTTLDQCFTMLAYFGVNSGFLLPNSKFDGGDPILRKNVSRLKKQLRIDSATKARDAGVNINVQRCTPLDGRTVELLLSAFRVYTKQRFRSLPRADRHYTVANLMQHTAGMRFGHFLYRSYTVHSFARDTSGSFHLATD